MCLQCGRDGIQFSSVSGVRGRKKKNDEVKEEEILTAGQIRSLLNSMKDRLFDEHSKTSVVDFIRLLQLYQDMKEREPKEIQVRWINPVSSTGK